ncbi:MAG: glycosyltransferase involved in cell wall biosynthesis [Kiritimatiellia bacterium]|jgi:glycosyltransferase involved in cell wall biosynthesis
MRGGTEGQCARVSMGHVNLGYTHRVAVFRREGFFLDVVEQTCGSVVDVGIRRMVSFETYRAIRRLADWIRHEGFDVVHLWDMDAVLFGSIAARMAGVPYITSRRDMAQIYPRHKLAMLRFADRKAAGIVANAQAINHVLEREGRRRIWVVPNILDVAEFDFQAQQSGEWPIPAGPFLVGMVARLDPEKDVDTFIRGLSRARERIPELHGVIAGDGVNRKELEALAKSHGREEAFTFLGEISEIPRLIRCLQVGVLVPKSNEGLSNTLLEYMAGRLPVIATDCGGNRELVQEETGRLIDVGDEKALAEALIEFYEQAPLREQLGRAGRALVERRHHPDVVCKRFMEIYSEVQLDLADAGPATL